MFFRTLIAFLCFVTTSPLWAELKASSPEILRDIEFANPGGHSLLMDLYRPAIRKGRTPVVVFVHGGGWKNGSRKSAQKNAAWLAEHGFTVAAIEYRLTNVAQWPAQIDDCYTAVRWLRDHADEYQLNGNRIGAWGTSAGGHLAILMGTRSYPGPETTSSRVQAICDWFGPSELMSMPPNNVGNGRTAEDVTNSNGAKLLGATVREVPDLATDASGIDHVDSKDPPFLIMHGDADPGVPLSQSEKLHEKLQSVGAEAQLNILPGAGHGGKQFSTPESRQIVLNFFLRTLKPDWTQAAGPHANYTTRTGVPPTSWSVTRNENVVWKKTLPETGQSTVVVSGDHLFFTTMKPVETDSALGQDVVGWCCDAHTGETLWTREMPGDYPLRLSGCFSDSTGPPPVTDGEHVCFFNASGRISCFDFSGDELWTKETMAVGRAQPFFHDGSVVFIRQQYMPDDKGHFSHEHKNAPLAQWTQLQAIELKTGEVRWTSQCGANMGCIPVPCKLSDGRTVIVVGRGGGHSPPEKPEGISLVDAKDGSTIWTLPLEGFMSTMTFNIFEGEVLVFHGGEHLWVNVETGKISRKVSIVDEVPVRVQKYDTWTTERRSIKAGKKKREIIQQSNILVGNEHYFRSYTQPWVGRVHVKTGAVEYLQLPVQMKPGPEKAEDQLLWDWSGLPKDILVRVQSKRKKPGQQVPITQWAFEPNSMLNSRGFEVMGDARSRGNGWGHHASAIPTAIGGKLFIPVMSGTVYVLQSGQESFDEKALVSINDLGPIGPTWTRSSLSFANGRLYARTVHELLCIGQR